MLTWAPIASPSPWGTLLQLSWGWGCVPACCAQRWNSGAVQGAQNVRCARCGHITSVPPPRGACRPPDCLAVLPGVVGAHEPCLLCLLTHALPSSPVDLPAGPASYFFCCRERYGAAGMQQPALQSGAHVPSRCQPSAVLSVRQPQLRLAGEEAAGRPLGCCQSRGC